MSAPGPELAGVYTGGAWAVGGYVPRRSDLDVAGVPRSPRTSSEAKNLARALSHRAVPCPARKLELVACRGEQASASDPGAGFELNLNSGEGVPDLVGTVPGPTGSHRFAIDRHTLATAGSAIVGPTAAETLRDLTPRPSPACWRRWCPGTAGTENPAADAGLARGPQPAPAGVDPFLDAAERMLRGQRPGAA